jgi:hypothetical protein
MVVIPVMEMAAMVGEHRHAGAVFASLTSIWELRCGMLFREAEDSDSGGKNKGGKGFLKYLRRPDCLP